MIDGRTKTATLARLETRISEIFAGRDKSEVAKVREAVKKRKRVAKATSSCGEHHRGGVEETQRSSNTQKCATVTFEGWWVRHRKTSSIAPVRTSGSRVAGDGGVNADLARTGVSGAGVLVIAIRIAVARATIIRRTIDDARRVDAGLPGLNRHRCRK